MLVAFLLQHVVHHQSPCNMSGPWTDYSPHVFLATESSTGVLKVDMSSAGFGLPTGTYRHFVSKSR